MAAARQFHDALGVGAKFCRFGHSSICWGYSGTDPSGGFHSTNDTVVRVCVGSILAEEGEWLRMKDYLGPWPSVQGSALTFRRRNTILNCDWPSMTFKGMKSMVMVGLNSVTFSTWILDLAIGQYGGLKVLFNVGLSLYVLIKALVVWGLTCFWRRPSDRKKIYQGFSTLWPGQRVVDSTSPSWCWRGFSTCDAPKK